MPEAELDTLVDDPEFSEHAREMLRGKDKSYLTEVLGILNIVEQRRRQANPLKYFIPNGRQEELIKAVGHDKKKWIYLMPAGNSLGKTAIAVNILGNIMWGPQNPWYTGPRFDDWPFPKKFWYISEQNTLKTVVCGIDENGECEIKKWFPKGKFTFVKAGLDYFSRLTTDTGWEGSFLTYDQDVKQFEGAKIGVAIFDEPPPEQIFNAVLARMTLGGIILMPMTPLTHAAWTLDRLVEQQEGDVFVMYGDIEENCKQHGIRGRLEHEHIERILAQYDEEEIEARAHGRYAHLSGVIYKGLHPEKHRHDFEPRHFNQQDYTIIHVNDPHDVKPPAIAWFAIGRDGRCWVVDEYPNDPYDSIKSFNKSTREICEDIKQREWANGWNPNSILRVMDPNFGMTMQQSVGMRTFEHYLKIGKEIGWKLAYFTKVNDSLADGHRAVRDLIKLTADGEALLRVGRNCKNVWHHLTHYMRKERAGKRLDVDGPGEDVAQKFKDFADVTRYFSMFMRPPKPLPKQLTAKEKLERQEEYAVQTALKDWRIDLFGGVRR